MHMRDLRVAAFIRARGACEHCGRPLDQGWQVHHRLPGGMGGTRRGRDVLSNVLALRSACHNLEPTSVHMTPAAARDAGWLISTGDSRDPAEIPVRLWGGDLVLLDDQGGFTVHRAGG